MKTPWHRLLLQYGTAMAAFTVIVLAGVVMMAAVVVFVLASKLSLFIK